MRELRHPWMLVHIQDRKSRRRCTKPRRQYGLSGATSLLSLGYLFCHPSVPQKDVMGSLCPAFASATFFAYITVRRAFTTALYSWFPTTMSSPLGRPDIFSGRCHPSQTAHMLLSPIKGEWFHIL